MTNSKIPSWLQQEISQISSNQSQEETDLSNVVSTDNSLLIEEDTLWDKEKNRNTIEISNTTLSIESQLLTADEFVSKRYLSNLEHAEIVEFDKSNYPNLAGMSWFKITKMVYENDVFFPNQISTLYAALHGESRQMALVVQKKAGCINIYIGVRDKDGEGFFHSGSLLEKGFSGIFPGICLEQEDPMIVPSNSDFALSSVSGVASLRDDDNKVFIQGLERLINATIEINNFTAVIIADSIETFEATKVISGYKSLYTELLPLAKTQHTYSESIGQSESETTTKGFSKSINTSIGRTITNGTTSTKTHTHTDGTSQTMGTSKSHTLGGHLGIIITGGNYNYNTGYNKSETINQSDAISNATGKTYQEANAKTETRGDSVNESKANQTMESNTKTSSVQVSVENKHISYLIDALNNQIQRLEKSTPYGLWNCCTYFIADTTTTAKNLANIYRGLLVGEESGMQTMAVNTWSQNSSAPQKLLPYIQNSLNPLFSYNGFDVTAASIVNSKELAIHMSLPQSSIPGLLVREQATFGRNVQRKDGRTELQSFVLGKIYHLDKEESLDVCLGLNELSKHTFVTGSTGSGKSNTIYKILNSLPEEINYLVIEPAKGEYTYYLNGKIREIKTFGSERHSNSLLRINPFKFPKNIDIYEHIGKLVEIFNVCWPMYAAMPAVLKDSIIRAYEACGWNLRKSENHLSLYPTFKDVLQELQNVARFSEYSTDTKADYLGSLETRLTSLTNGINGEILVDSNDLDDSLLFDSRTIIDLSCLDTDSRSLVMGLLTLKLYEHRKSQNKKNGCPNRNLHHVTVLEEAHNILPKTSKQQSQESSNLIGKSVEMISNAIAEMRTYGEGFIIADQSPTSVDEASIKNTNTKIIMSLPDGDDRYIVGKSVGLNDSQIEEISLLPTGVGVVFQNNWSSAVLCKIPLQSRYENEVISNSLENSRDEKENIMELIKIYRCTNCNEETQNRLISILFDCHVRSSLKHEIITKKIFDIEELQNACALAFVDIIGTNIAKEADSFHFEYICHYVLELQKLIRRKLGFTEIGSDELLMLADMYLRGMNIRDIDLYKKWRKIYYES